MSFIKKYKWQIALTITFVIGMIFASFFDLQISKAIADLKPGKYYSENIIGLFFESFGVNPVYLLVAFARSVIYQNFNRRQNSKLRIIIMILCVITSIVMFALMFKKTFKYIGEHYGFVNQLGGFWDTVAYGLFGVILTFVLIV